MAEEAVQIPEGQDPGNEEVLETEELEPKETAEPGEEPSTEWKDEVSKRFGEGLTDQEYMQKTWEAYRNGETTFSKGQNELQTYKDLVDKLGGADALKNVINQPTQPQNQLPPEVRGLVDAGYLNPQDPIHALVINMAQRQSVLEQSTTNMSAGSAKDKFESKLTKDVAVKYPNADLDGIRQVAYAGGFKDLNDDQLWQMVDSMAKNMENKVNSLVEKGQAKKLEELKGLGKTSISKGAGGRTKTGSLTPRQAYEKAWDEKGLGSELTF